MKMITLQGSLKAAPGRPRLRNVVNLKTAQKRVAIKSGKFLEMKCTSSHAHSRD